MSSLHVLSMFPHTHFSPVCEFLADFEDSHTAKTGLLRCCLYISSSSVSSSCLLCCRGKLYSPNKEKILARQSYLHFLILLFLLLRTFLHSRGPLPLLNASFLLSSTLQLSRTSSSILSANSSSFGLFHSGSHLSIFHLFNIFLHTDVQFFLQFLP